MDSNNVAENSEKKPRGKPFVKDDPRCWRLGRPKTSDEVRSLAQAIWHEKAYTNEGKPIVINGHHATNLEVKIRQMVASKDWRQVTLALEYAFGKVPNPVQVTGADAAPLAIHLSWGDDAE